MSNKPIKEGIERERFSHEILGFLGIAFAISVFLFGFLYLTASSLAEIYFEKIYPSSYKSELEAISVWIRSISLLSASLFFVILFSVLLGQKVSYLREIIRGVEALRIHRMDYKVLVEGNDELSELAQSINYLCETERKLLEREKQMSEGGNRLIRALSHDIRTPLTSMLSYTQYLKEKREFTQEEMNEYLDMMYKKELQMKELTDRLLEDSERKVEYIENGKFLMKQLTEEWLELLEEKFHCKVDMENCPEFSIEIDIHELRRIFDNLSSNVEKYADVSQEVTLQIYEESGYVIIAQQNTTGERQDNIDRHHIGLGNIRQIVGFYGGNVEITQNKENFDICIALTKIKTV